MGFWKLVAWEAGEAQISTFAEIECTVDNKVVNSAHNTCCVQPKNRIGNWEMVKKHLLRYFLTISQLPIRFLDLLGLFGLLFSKRGSKIDTVVMLFFKKSITTVSGFLRNLTIPVSGVFRLGTPGYEFSAVLRGLNIEISCGAL